MSRTVIEHSGISPRRIGHGKRNIPTAVAQFYSSFYGPVLALLSLTLPSLYFCAVRQRAVGNEYLRCTSPRPGVPARETSAYHTEFTALPPPQLATYKVTNLQHRCAAPCRACISRSSWMRTGERTLQRRSYTFRARDLNSYVFRRNSHGR